jgi:hypothetical protein
VIGTLWLIYFLTISLGLTSCHSYDPSLYPSYDVLNPGPEVRMNPLGFDTDGNAIVNLAFIAWVDELKAEVKKLRELAKED